MVLHSCSGMVDIIMTPRETDFGVQSDPQVPNQYLLCLREGASHTPHGHSGLHLYMDWTENVKSKSWVVGYEGR